jgi:hypothetical protein
MKAKSIPVVLLGAFVGLAALAYVSFRDVRQQRNEESHKEKTTIVRHPLILDTDGRVRAFYVTVDRDGVYFGAVRVDFDIALSYLDEIARKENVYNVCVYATDFAKYGDLVHFYLGVDRSKYFLASFPTRAITSRREWPLVGVFQKGDDSWYDPVNGGEIL